MSVCACSDTMPLAAPVQKARNLRQARLRHGRVLAQASVEVSACWCLWRGLRSWRTAVRAFHRTGHGQGRSQPWPLMAGRATCGGRLRHASERVRGHNHGRDTAAAQSTCKAYGSRFTEGQGGDGARREVPSATAGSTRKKGAHRSPSSSRRSRRGRKRRGCGNGAQAAGSASER